MRYVYEGGKDRACDAYLSSRSGWQSDVCGAVWDTLVFNRSINTPFALGRNVCKNCERVLRQEPTP